MVQLRVNLRIATFLSECIGEKFMQVNSQTTTTADLGIVIEALSGDVSKLRVSGSVSFKLVTLNIFSMLDGSRRKALKHPYNDVTKRSAVAHDLMNQKVDIAGFQESRTPKSHQMVEHFYVVSGGSECHGNTNHFGCELWISTKSVFQAHRRR